MHGQSRSYTINEGISCSYVNEQDKTVPFNQSMPANQQATNTTLTNRGRRNGRYTRNNTHYNISTHQEDFYQEHSSIYLHSKNNGGSHGQYQHTHRIDDTVLPNNGPYQDNPHSPAEDGTLFQNRFLLLNVTQIIFKYARR